MGHLSLAFGRRKAVFCDKRMSAEKSKLEALAREMFEMYDVDKSGLIDITEIENVMKASLKYTPRQASDDEVKAAANAMMTRLDRNGDGKLSFEEFLPDVEQMFKQ